MIKNISIIFCGILFGGILTVLIANYYYQTEILSKTASAVNPESIGSLNSLGVPSGASESDNSWLYSLTFRQASLIDKSNANLVAIQAFNTAQTIFTEIAETNNSIIYKNLVLLREKTIQQDWKGIFNIVTQIKVTIDENKSRLAEVEKELQVLEGTNKVEYTTYIVASRTLSSVIVSYFDALNNILVGSVPTKEKADAVNTEIEKLKNAYWEHKNAADTMLGMF